MEPICNGLVIDKGGVECDSDDNDNSSDDDDDNK
jgi:hypothetical protein